jgi:hypothetical protein
MAQTSSTVFAKAIQKYGTYQLTETITHSRKNLDLFLKEQLVFESLHSFTCVVTDPKDEFDDLMMLRYGVYNTIGDVIVVISAGYFTPQERLDHLIEVFPCFQGATFGETLETPHGGHILFLEDGEPIPYKIKRFVNCGPCSSVTLNSIEFEESAIVIIVGANDDDVRLSTGINQKQTDEPGKLIQIIGVWNGFIDKARSKNALIHNISVNVSRYVLFPNPLKCGQESPMYNLDPKIVDVMIKTAAMFLASRPPPQFGLRVNEGNSIVDIQLYNSFDPLSERYQQGLKKVEEYMELAKSKGLGPEYYESAAIPIMITYCMGGVYKDGVFGFSPTDREAKETIGCLMAESVQVFIESIQQLDYFTPGYDPLAYIEAFRLKV